MAAVTVAFDQSELSLSELSSPLPIDELIPGRGRWEVEIGFGKGRYLLRRAQEYPEVRFLGIEIAGKYFRRVRARLVKRQLGNLLLLRGEALYLLSAVLPDGFAAAVHVYFPDPWPKARHHARRLFDAETVDLVLALLAPGGSLFFASDFLEYGDQVAEILDSHPGVSMTKVSGPWDGVPRTNYEAKYLREQRAIRRFEVVRKVDSEGGVVHPRATVGLCAARCSREPDPARSEGAE